MTILQRHLDTLCRWTRTLGPYLMIELLLPGGTMIALLLLLYRRRKLALAVLTP